VIIFICATTQRCAIRRCHPHHLRLASTVETENVWVTLRTFLDYRSRARSGQCPRLSVLHFGYCSSSYIIVFNTTRFIRWEQCNADCLSLMNLQPFRLQNVFVPGVPAALSRYTSICPHTNYRRATATPPGLLREAATPCNWRNRLIFCYHRNENNWNQVVTKSAAVECDEFLIAVLLNWAEYQNSKEYH